MGIETNLNSPHPWMEHEDRILYTNLTDGSKLKDLLFNLNLINHSPTFNLPFTRTAHQIRERVVEKGWRHINSKLFLGEIKNISQPISINAEKIQAQDKKRLSKSEAKLIEMRNIVKNFQNSLSARTNCKISRKKAAAAARLLIELKTYQPQPHSQADRLPPEPSDSLENQSISQQDQESVEAI